MPIIDLKHRVSSNWDEVHKYLKSPDSYVYVKDRAIDETSNPASMEVEVGDAYIIPGDNKQYKISEEGLKVPSRNSVVLYSKQKIMLPYNVFGVVTGKGNLIFQGCFISTGKIDPGFDGYLKIGFYNGGNKEVVLRNGEKFASLFFISTEGTLEAPLQNYQSAPPALLKHVKCYTRLWIWMKSNRVSLITWLFALPAALHYSKDFVNFLINLFK